MPLSTSTAAEEDYAKAIYALESRCGGAVSTNALADRLEVSAGSASAMVKKLAARGLVEHVPYRGVRLTAEGARLALEVLRHHRLIELYLAEELDMPWDRVHAEAEILEHAISEELEELIAAKLGHPELDPHGDPIPTRELKVVESAGVALDTLAAGDAGTFVRVSDSDPEMLRYLGDRGIAPGDPLVVEERQPFGGPLTVRVGDTAHALGGDLARAMRVRLDSAAGPASLPRKTRKDPR